MEIKQVTKELNYLVDFLDKGFTRYQEDYGNATDLGYRENCDAGSQTVTEGILVGIQTEWDEVEFERQREEHKCRTEINEVLRSGGGFAELAPLLDKTWPEDS